MYIHTYICVFLRFNKKVVENVFSAKVTKLCTTHTHTCTDIQKKHARICNCLKIITILYAQFQTLAQRTQLLNLSIFTKAALLAFLIFVDIISRIFFPHLYIFSFAPCYAFGKTTCIRSCTRFCAARPKYACWSYICLACTHAATWAIPHQCCNACKWDVLTNGYFKSLLGHKWQHLIVTRCYYIKSNSARK